MPKQLFPKEIINNSAEANFQKHTVRTKLIYCTTILFAVGSLLLLPFIEVNVSVRSQGVIKSIIERNQLIPLVSGKIDELYIKENKAINKGDRVAVIATPLIQKKLQFNTSRQQRIKKYLQDLAVLKKVDSSSVLEPIGLQTPKYSHSLSKLQQQIRVNMHEVAKAKKTYQRDKQLYTKSMLSKATYDETTFTLRTAQNKLQLLLKQQLNAWQAEQVTYQEELDQLRAKQQQLKEEQQQHIIKAPVSGTIQNMQGIYKGSFVSPNKPLAEISPDTGLIAESYVPPKDVGLIREGMKARFQISAYDFNQWGMLAGNVISISKDVSIINNKPVFIVRSRLDRTYLELQNGYRGSLKKGMTMQTRFTITSRSLFQLLYDNVDDWLNPNLDEGNNQSQTTAL